MDTSPDSENYNFSPKSLMSTSPLTEKDKKNRYLFMGPIRSSIQVSGSSEFTNVYVPMLSTETKTNERLSEVNKPYLDMNSCWASSFEKQKIANIPKNS